MSLRHPVVVTISYPFMCAINVFSTQQHTATTATHCNALQHTATHCNCNALQRTATYCSALPRTATHCNALQRTATHCSALQRTAEHCNALQRTAAHCNALQHLLIVTIPYRFMCATWLIRYVYLCLYIYCVTYIYNMYIFIYICIYDTHMNATRHTCVGFACHTYE